MSKQTSTFEWQVVKDDNDWMHLCTQTSRDRTPNEEVVIQGRLFSRRFVWEVATILLVLTSAASWYWRTNQSSSPPSAEVVGDQVPLPQPVASPDHNALVARVMDDLRREVNQMDSSTLTGIPTSSSTADLGMTLSILDVQGDQAIIRIIKPAANGAPAYRQTRFYRREQQGWRQTAPDASLWGPERSLETPSFIYHFRQHDADAIIAVVPQVEELYTTLRHNFGVDLPSSTEKLIIGVRVTEFPGHTSPWFGTLERILVPSPAVYWAPVELTDAELLAQSLALALLGDVLAQADKQYAISVAAKPLINGLHLWQLWDLDLPLSAWREEIVKWIYVDLPATKPGEAIPLPAHYTTLCAAHKLWVLSPMQLDIPLLCVNLGQAAEYYPLWDARDPLMRLDQLLVSMHSDDVYRSNKYGMDHPSQAVALATLIEYAVATFGRERLPVLVAGLGQYKSWETLIPAVLGVSSAEFEAGWQTYLAAHYGVPSPSIVTTK